MKSFRQVFIVLFPAMACMILASCSVNKFIPEESYMLDGVAIHSDEHELSTSVLQGYIRQHPNSKWFSLLKVPLHIYSISGLDSTKRVNRFIRRMGEAPVIYDSQLSERTRQNVMSAVQNLGYLNADVETVQTFKKNRVRVKYLIHPSQRYSVRSIERDIQDSLLAEVIESSNYVSKLYEDMPFDLNVLDAERSSINSFLQNNGYFRFNKDFVRFEADTTIGNHQVDLRMMLLPYRGVVGREPSSHQQYRIGSVDYSFSQTDNKPFVRPKLIGTSNNLSKGELYREQDVQNTYARLNRLVAIQSTNIKFTENAADSSLLDAHVTLNPSKKNSINAEIEGTNSAGDFGAAVVLSYQNRNLFRGSELFNVKLRGAFEAIKGLSGYLDQNYIEYSAETGLAFPHLLFPFLRESFRRQVQGTSEVNFGYDSQDRPEFHRRVVNGVWRYKWNHAGKKMNHKVDLIDLNYVFMPWISETFRIRYLEDPDNRNAILRYNYENLFIMKWGYSFSYSSLPLNASSNNYGTNAYTIRAGIESAGNLLYGISSMGNAAKNKDGQYTLFNIAYAQYVKGDFDFSKSFRVNESNSVALHFGLGVAYPYGNSRILPYEKRYFSGGANSVRGWSVRELGPGSFVGNDGKIDFINQTGDIKLDMNLEYRTHLFWKFDGAVFVDAGNIWTIRAYDEQPGGQFKFDTFWRQIAVAYGLGVRLNFNYFILRLDGGMKAIHPAYTDSKRHYPIAHPDFKRDFSFHFAVGLPF